MMAMSRRNPIKASWEACVTIMLLVLLLSSSWELWKHWRDLNQRRIDAAAKWYSDKRRTND